MGKRASAQPPKEKPMSTLTTIVRTTVAAAALGLAGLGLAGTAVAAPVPHPAHQSTYVATADPAAPELTADACAAAKTPAAECADAAHPTHKSSRAR
jgi:hypothetical protein